MKLSINQTDIYYVKQGTGSPLILLHGNGEDHTIFNDLIIKLSQFYTVYAIDSRGHGQSTKSKMLTYDIMADDIISFIKEFQLTRPILYGFSDGGIIGIIIAIKDPLILQKLIVSGINVSPNGLKLYLLSYYFIKQLLFKDPLIALMIKEPHIDKEQLHKIVIPVYLIVGTKDVIKNKHTLYINENIKGSKLIVVDHATHASYVYDNDRLYQLLISILNQ